MTTYRIRFTYTEEASVDIDAPGEEEAKEFFWQHVRRTPHFGRGSVTAMTITEKGGE